MTVSQGATLPYKNIKPNSMVYFEKVQVQAFEKCRNNISHWGKFCVNHVQCPHLGTEVILNWMLAPSIFSWCVKFYCLVFIYLTNLTFYRKALMSSHCICSARAIKPGAVKLWEEGLQQRPYFYFIVFNKIQA